MTNDPSDPPRSLGRPSSFTQETADTICNRLSEGESLREVCQAPDMPDKATVYRWLAQREEFQRQYAAAREVQADILGDDLLEIADNGSPEDTQRARLRVDARKWLMSKLAPKKYGDRIAQEVSGPGGAPIEVKTITDLERAKALASLLSKMQRQKQEAC